ncbi:MAG TPA: CHAT domain-containing protein [Candidatus Sulfotelmatobacter sp.]|nr:CHAT domain-containing protein [Candidatus Sulfotelmatobacter sp.]
MKPASRTLPWALAAVLLFAFAGNLGMPSPAGGQGPPGGKTYGLEISQARDAVAAGEGRQALAYYEAQAGSLEKGDAAARRSAAVAYTCAVLVANSLGEYQRAIRNGLRAVALLEKIPEEETNITDMRARGRAVLFLAGSYAAINDVEGARRYYQATIEVARRGQRASPVFQLSLEGAARTGLAALAFREGDYAKAIEEAKTALSLVEVALQMFLNRGSRATRPPGWDDSVRAMTSTETNAWLTRGRAEAALKRWDDAERSLQRVIDKAMIAKAVQRDLLARVILTDVKAARGDAAAAETTAQDALAKSKALGLAPVTILLLGRAGARDAAAGNHAAALQTYREALSLVEAARGQLQEASLRSVFLEDKQALYHGAARSAAALGQPEEAFAFAERARARAFLDLLGTQTPLSKGRTEALLQDELRLREDLAAGQAAVEAAAEDSTDTLGAARQRLALAQQAYQKFLDTVRKENVEQASLLSVEPASLPDIQRLLPEGITLLEYLVAESETLLWVVTRDRVTVVRLPLARAALVAEVRALRQAVETQAPLPALQAQARALYDHLLAPARPHLAGDRLLLIPHDVLHYLPWAALRTPADKWLMEEATLATLPSASVLMFLQKKGTGTGAQTLAVGNPDVGPALNLRYAEREARAVGAHYPGATVLVRQDATETRVKVLSAKAGLLHLATHGELDVKDPLSSALLLVPDGADDGRLEVRKIFGLDLHARLVVLSACETGLGKLSKGDELVGLQRAFLYAGTPAVVTTLWKVDDRASFRLMEAFYDALDAQGPAGALRQAQQETMAAFPHPFAWAAFGLTGMAR